MVGALFLARRCSRTAVVTLAARLALARPRHTAAARLAALRRRVAASRLATVAVAAVIVAIVVARVAATRHCLSAVASRLVTRRSHTVVAARRQVCRYLIVVTLLLILSYLGPAAVRFILPLSRQLLCNVSLVFMSVVAGKVILITGPTSGIGLALLERLASSEAANKPKR